MNLLTFNGLFTLDNKGQKTCFWLCSWAALFGFVSFSLSRASPQASHRDVPLEGQLPAVVRLKEHDLRCQQFFPVSSLWINLLTVLFVTCSVVFILLHYFCYFLKLWDQMFMKNIDVAACRRIDVWRLKLNVCDQVLIGVSCWNVFQNIICCWNNFSPMEIWVFT